MDVYHGELEESELREMLTLESRTVSDTAKICHKTMNLRVVRPDISLAFLGSPDPVQIQQQWQCDDGSTYWQDIDTVTVSTAQNFPLSNTGAE